MVGKLYQIRIGKGEQGHAERLRSKAVAHGGRRFPVLAVYDLCLKCSHLFNLMDARGVISVTERAALIARVRSLACAVAQIYLEQGREVSPERATAELIER